ncbi:MAG: helix-turn-helix transcriptional regulator [Desulfomonile tiedjei]|nr:helix-turn-helix transcriptional regulator [Desulfomonile tiedjei]
MTKMRLLRQARGMTIETVGELAGFSSFAIRGIETGRTKYPTLRLGLALEKVFGVPITELLEEVPVGSLFSDRGNGVRCSACGGR